MQEYKHRPLNLESSEIRLLRVEKSLDESAPITLTLRHANLDEDKFIALSYAWGDENPMFEILIRDGSTLGTFHVRKNLYEYLRSARPLTNDWTLEWIWIDQICIKQIDHEERCHQVAQMERLYRTTEATIVWPGSLPEAECKSSEAWSVFNPQLLKELYVGYQKYGPSWTLPSGRLFGKITYGQLLFLITTPYWKRLWVLQEILLAPQVYVLFLNQLCLLEDLYNVIMVANTHGLLSETDADAQASATELKGRLANFMVYRHENVLEAVKEKGGFYWSDILVMSRGTNCTIPLDRVYGVLGLVMKPLRIPPDYNITMMELLIRLLRGYISALKINLTKSDWAIRELSDVVVHWFDNVVPDPDLMGVGAFELMMDLKSITEDPGRKDEVKHTLLLILEKLGVDVPE